jgi:hypothetical protein
MVVLFNQLPIDIQALVRDYGLCPLVTDVLAFLHEHSLFFKLLLGLL